MPRTWRVVTRSCWLCRLRAVASGRGWLPSVSFVVLAGKGGSGGSVPAIACWRVSWRVACFRLSGLGVGFVPDRLLVDLGGDGQAEVLVVAGWRAAGAGVAGAAWRGRWMRMRWRICAGIWRITCWRRSGCGRTAARRCRRSWPGGGIRFSGRCSAPARRVMRTSGRGTGAWRWCSGPPSRACWGCRGS